MLSPALSQASHSPFSVHIRPCCRTATETYSSMVEMTSPATIYSTTPRLPQGISPSRRDRPSCCPPRHRGRPAGGSSRSSPSAWQTPDSPSLRRLAHGRFCGPLRPLSGSHVLDGTETHEDMSEESAHTEARDPRCLHASELNQSQPLLILHPTGAVASTVKNLKNLLFQQCHRRINRGGDHRQPEICSWICGTANL